MNTTLPLFYKKVVPLNKKLHQHLYIEPINNYSHARSTNSVYITAVEFLSAGREYPIVFGKGEDGSVFPVALLGLENDRNLYVNARGKWLANYVPAYVRRYPFILAFDKKNNENFAVCIDESYSGLNDKKKGVQLFTDDGEASSFLKKSVDFLKDYQVQIQATSNICNEINELELLAPMQFVLKKEEKKQALGGFMCVNRKKLKDLPTEKLAEMARNDYLELIYAHLHSLANLEVLTSPSK
jgi:hypothetical protein